MSAAGAIAYAVGGAWFGSASARTPRVCSRAGRRNAATIRLTAKKPQPIGGSIGSAVFSTVFAGALTG